MLGESGCTATEEAGARLERYWLTRASAATSAGCWGKRSAKRTPLIRAGLRRWLLGFGRNAMTRKKQQIPFALRSTSGRSVTRCQWLSVTVLVALARVRLWTESFSLIMCNKEINHYTVKRSLQVPPALLKKLKLLSRRFAGLIYLQNNIC